MKSNFIKGLAVFLLLLMSASCGREPAVSSQEGMASSSQESVSSEKRESVMIPSYDPTPPTEEELAQAKEEVQVKLDKAVNLPNITKVELIFSTPSGGRGESTDLAIIGRWVSLLKKLDLTAVPCEVMNGALGYEIYFYDEEEQISACTVVGTFISNGSPKYHTQINNYEELRDEFMALQLEMGFTFGRPIEP